MSNEIDEINGSFEKIRVTKMIPCICEECQEEKQPHFFRMKTLDRYLEKGRYEITCDRSCIDMNVRRLTAVLLDHERFDELDKKAAQKKQDKIEQLKQQHIEYHPAGQVVNIYTTDTVQVGQNQTINQYDSDPQINAALTTLVTFLKEVQQKHPQATADSAGYLLNAEARTMEQNEPQRWQTFRQQLQTLPQDIRQPERWKQGGKNALMQVVTDLADNVFLNAVVAFLDGFSGEVE